MVIRIKMENGDTFITQIEAKTIAQAVREVQHKKVFLLTLKSGDVLGVPTNKILYVVYNVKGNNLG